MQNRYCGAVAQSSLLGSGMPQTFKPIFSIAKHGKRPANTAFILSRYSSNSLRGNDPSAAFLQQAQTALANSEICQDSSMPCQLSPFRSDPCSSLRHHGRIAKNQQDRNPAIQRGVPFLAGTFPVSRSIYLTALPQKVIPQSHSANRRVTRPTSSPVIYLAPAPKHPGLRFRFGGPNDLWKTPVCQSRLQSQKARPPILPSAPVLRSPLARILAWISASWKCRQQHRRGSVSKNMFGQGSSPYGPIANPVSGRFGLLRKKSHRVLRFRRMRLCDRGQRIPDHQDPRPRMSFPEASQWLGSRRVCVQTRPLEKSSSVCRGQTADSRRSRRSPAVDAFQRSKICLSRLGYEPENSSLASLEILRQTGHDRKEYTRASLRLSSRENSYGGLGGQCGFLSDSSLGLQPCALVQKALLAPRISLRHAGYDSDGFPCLAGQVNPSWSPQPASIAQRLSLSKVVRKCSQENR